jgi:Flp pilus assembly pilin Flp
VSRIRRIERGTAFIEYVFLAALIAVVCLAAVTLLGQHTDGSASRSASSIVSATP